MKEKVCSGKVKNSSTNFQMPSVIQNAPRHHNSNKSNRNYNNEMNSVGNIGPYHREEKGKITRSFKHTDKHTDNANEPNYEIKPKSYIEKMVRSSWRQKQIQAYNMAVLKEERENRYNRRRKGVTRSLDGRRVTKQQFSQQKKSKKVKFKVH